MKSRKQKPPSRDDVDLEIYEKSIRKWRSSALNAAKALRWIHDGKLYRSRYGTFAEYCERRFQIQRLYGLRLVRFAEVAEILATAQVVPSGEAQVRSLAKLRATPSKLIEAWRLSVDLATKAGRKHPIGRDVQAAVDRITGNR